MSQIIDVNSVVGFTRVVTLSVAGNTVLDSFDIKLGNNAKFDRTDNQSKTTGSKVARGPLMGTAVAQLASAAVDPLTYFGQTFTVTEGTFFIYETGRAETKSGETKAAISFQEVPSGGVVTLS